MKKPIMKKEDLDKEYFKVSVSKSKLKKNAKRLKAYMDFRASHEKLKHEFDANFYYDCFKKGMRTFFGVLCVADGAIFRDNQNPEAYKEFLEHEKSTDLDKEYFKVSPDKTERTLH